MCNKQSSRVRETVVSRCFQRSKFSAKLARRNTDRRSTILRIQRLCDALNLYSLFLVLNYVSNSLEPENHNGRPRGICQEIHWGSYLDSNFEIPRVENWLACGSNILLSYINKKKQPDCWHLGMPSFLSAPPSSHSVTSSIRISITTWIGHTLPLLHRHPLLCTEMAFYRVAALT